MHIERRHPRHFELAVDNMPARHRRGGHAGTLRELQPAGSVMPAKERPQTAKARTRFVAWALPRALYALVDIADERTSTDARD
jgi:hypothetical protein